MKVAVIGAGAAGLMAAYAAAMNGNDVTVFEKNEKCGKKIYITGKGRCNVTHESTPEEFLQNVVSNSKFLISSINSFTPQDTVKFFERGGTKLKLERGGRYFPISDKASDVSKCLEKYCLNAGVKFKFNENVLNLLILQSTMSGIATTNGEYRFDKVIVCTGGISYPSTGSTGDGYKFAMACNHTVVDLKPALCGMNLKGKYFAKLQGLSLKNIKLSVIYNGKLLKSFFGEMLFTHFGVSGPCVLSASSIVNGLDLNRVRLIIDFKPALDERQLDNRLLRDFDVSKNKDIANCLKLLLPLAVIDEVLQRCDISAAKKINSVTRDERQRIVDIVKNFELKPASLRDFSEAIVTAGGVSVKEINPKTMESKLISGLYFCGEVLDLDALTGGYNLQIAFSTGFAAGNSIGG